MPINYFFEDQLYSGFSDNQHCPILYSFVQICNTSR
jgi:hypothetical protein